MTQSKRIAAIDWMRGFVMVLMMLDHVSMVYSAGHLGGDSAAKYVSGTVLPGFEFFSRWMTHLCAPTFVFLAGTALAISVERKVVRGIESWHIDRDILLRGAFIALLDPTLISFFSGKLLFQVLYAIGVAMMCMALLRRLPSSLLLALVFGWFIFGEILTVQGWPPGAGEGSIVKALLFSSYSSSNLSIMYPLLPWLAMMIVGWVFGRYLLDYGEGRKTIGPVKLLFATGVAALCAYGVVRYLNGYGNMLLLRDSNTWQQWLHVSKYPPSATFALLELGLMAMILALMISVERIIGVRPNGVLLVFGQTSMVFYLVHRLVLTGSGTYGGLRDVTDLQTCYLITFVFLLLLYPFCLWYRGYKSRHVATSRWLTYL
ncbi:MAG: heparan-alpha-glucosaminide N-acetyltransferase domain-containing protein [Thermodesulfobacteriota bacterium]|nr:heparan-alpha-glucosaminide N-acetyltransferase domain-containing protein [Thermodesulfobacteriota bacterium]